MKKRRKRQRCKGAANSVSICPSCKTAFVFGGCFVLFFHPLKHLLKICPNGISLGTEGVLLIFLSKSSERTRKKQNCNYMEPRVPLLTTTFPQMLGVLLTEPNGFLVSGSSQRYQSSTD